MRSHIFWSSVDNPGDLMNESSDSGGVEIENHEFYKEGFGLNDNDEIQKDAMVAPDMACVKREIDQYASVFLSDLVSEYKEFGYTDYLNLSELLLAYMDKDRSKHTSPLSKFRKKVHHLHSITLAGATRNMITGLYELVQMKASHCLFESEVFKYLDPLTLSFYPITMQSIDQDASENASHLQLINVRASKTYTFVAALKYFISACIKLPEGLTPDTFCTIRLFLAPPDEYQGVKNVQNVNNLEWYMILTPKCQCKDGVHDWLAEFISCINTYNQMVKLDPIYEIARLYLAFVERNCFGDETREMGMILLQALALKWLHYVTLHFNENEREFQDVFMMRSNLAVLKLVDFLQKVLARSVRGIISRSRGVTYSPGDRDVASDTEMEDLDAILDTEVEEVTEVQATVDPGSKNGEVLCLDLSGDISKKEFLPREVSLKLESVLAVQKPGSQDDFNEKESTGSFTAPGFRFPISRSASICQKLLYDQPKPSTRRDSCAKCSEPWFWAQKCDAYGWKMASEDFSNNLGSAPKMRNLFNDAEIFNKGSEQSETKNITPENHVGCLLCGANGSVDECHTCGLGMDISPETLAHSIDHLKKDSDNANTDLPLENADDGPGSELSPSLSAFHLCSYESAPLKPVATLPLPILDWKNGGKAEKVELQGSRYEYGASYRSLWMKKKISLRLRNGKARRSSSKEQSQLPSLKRRHSDHRVLECVKSNFPFTCYTPSSPSDDSGDEERITLGRPKRPKLLRRNATYILPMHLANSEKRKLKISTLKKDKDIKSRVSPLLVEKLTNRSLASPWAVTSNTSRLLGLRMVNSAYEMKERHTDAKGGKWSDQSLD